MKRVGKFVLKKKNGDAILAVIIAIIFVVCVCSGVYALEKKKAEKIKKADDRIEEILSGKHELRKLAEYDKKISSWSAGGGFFAFVGGGSASGSSTTVKEVRFSWKMNDGKYAFSELKLDRVFVAIDDNIESPTVEFSYTKPGWKRLYESHEVNKLFYETFVKDERCAYIIGAVTFTCRSEDWPTQIYMPMNK